MHIDVTRFAGLEGRMLDCCSHVIMTMCDQEQRLRHYVSFCFNTFSLPLLDLFTMGVTYSNSQSTYDHTLLGCTSMTPDQVLKQSELYFEQLTLHLFITANWMH